MPVNRDDIILATIRCAHRVGLPAVTMKTIGKEVGILGQGLYNHFDCKESILEACFDYCKEQIGALYHGYFLSPEDDPETAVKKIWLRYLDYFAVHPAECAFYRNYRELGGVVPPPQEEDESYLKDLWRLVDELEERYGRKLSVPRKTMLYYVRNLTPYLARAISDGIMEDTPAVREQLWRMAFGGISAMLEKE